MNNLKNLTIRTKKSLSGLLSGYGDEGPASPKAAENTTPVSPATPLENDAAGLEEFGAVGRDSLSSSKDSPSKRHRLLGSLRTIGSMRSLRPGNVKLDDDTTPLSPAHVHPETIPVKRERPSLVLAFEEAPFHCFSGTEVEDIRHRAAALHITEPTGNSVIDPPGLSAFTVGSVMDSPAPIRKMLDRENGMNAIPRSLNSTLRMYDSAVPTPPVFSPMAECPLPTPMPGTNLPMDGDAGVLAPEIHVSSPATSAEEQDELPSYFNLMPMVVVQPHTDQEHADCTNSHVVAKESTAPDHESVFMLAQTENDIPQSHSSHITVVRKLKPCDSEETVISSMDSDQFTLDNESHSSLDAQKDMIRAFLVREKQPPIPDDTCALERRLSAWGRHNGLYDGTGYGDNEAAFHGMGISRTTGDGVVMKETPLSTPLPESLISEEDTIELAQHIIFEDSADGKYEGKVEDPLLLRPGKKSPKYTADERKETSARPYGKYADYEVKETQAIGVTEPLRPMPELPDSPIDEAAALDELIRTYGDHWYEKDPLEAQASRFVGRFPMDEVMVRDEMAVNKRKVEVKSTKMITEMNEKLGDIMPTETHRDAKKKGCSKEMVSEDTSNKTHGDVRETQHNLCYGRICKQYKEAYGEMTEDEKKAEEAAVAQMIWLINEDEDMKENMSLIVEDEDRENKILGNTQEPRARRFTCRLSEQDIEACGEPTDEMKSEVAESFKQMNESLGG